MTDTDTLVARLRELLAKAAFPEPLYVDEDTRPGMQWNRHIYCTAGTALCFMAHSGGKDPERDEARAALIAEGITALPALLSEVDRLRAEREAMKTECETYARLYGDMSANFDGVVAELERARERIAKIVAADAARAALGGGNA
jgi:hypothetical protein